MDSTEPARADTDLLTWVSGQWWAPWALFAVCMVIGLWMIRSILHHRGRAHRTERAARAADMQYREQDGYGLSRVGFDHMARGEGRGWTATNVVTLTAADGIRVHAFDVSSWVEYPVAEDDDGRSRIRRSGREPAFGARGTSKLVRKPTGATYSAAMARLSINGPRLVIARENVVSKIFSAATRLDLDLESEAFNRWYHVIGSDRSFARAVLDARMIDLMTRTEGRISFEFFGSWLLLHSARVQPELMPGLARLADEMRRVIPDLVVERWPSAGSPGPLVSGA